MASPSSASNQQIPGGNQKPQSTYGDFNQLQFIVNQELLKLNTATLVKVVSVTNAGGVSPVGFVDVQPLVNQLDAFGNPVPHVVAHNLPYVRVQGGANAIIIDPQPGDVGVAVFASRDISRIKATRKQGNPGSRRQFSLSDGLYIGGALNAAPSQYIQFNASGVTVTSPVAVTVNAPNVTVNAQNASIVATVLAKITAPIIQIGAAGQTLHAFVTSLFMALFNTHTHTTTTNGNPTSTPNQTMDASHVTSTVTGG